MYPSEFRLSGPGPSRKERIDMAIGRFDWETLELLGQEERIARLKCRAAELCGCLGSRELEGQHPDIIEAFWRTIVESGEKSCGSRTGARLFRETFPIPTD